MDIKNRRILVMGGKRSGMAVARLILQQGGYPKISDQAPLAQFSQDFRNWIEDNKIPFECGRHTSAFFEGSECVILSPGVRRDVMAALWAEAKGIPVLGEIEFAFQFCSKPVIAVTGSNGKTTTSTLIHQVLQEAGFKTRLCGNIGFAFSDFVLDLQDKDFVILEVSSFQLETLLSHQSSLCSANLGNSFFTRGFRPFIAIILNLSQNHLDRHKDMQEYFEAKKRIFQNQEKTDFAVLNFQDPYLRKLEGKLQAKVTYFNEPNAPNSLMTKNPNHSAVLAVAEILGIEKELCLKVCAEFKGVEHRLEWIRTLDGIDFVNDSKSTTVEAGRWALEHIEAPIFMICGGRDKNVDFSILRDIVGRKVKKMILIGEAREKFRKAFGEVIPLEEHQNLQEAVLSARQSAQKGDCVVLSPMCASFDMFENFEERGKQFKEIVNQLK